ncbi:MAG TPA: Maf family protein, partial [Vicinamibacterales bacterium]|nr:Maf family protein [Vicinamibacterales bacterium]
GKPRDPGEAAEMLRRLSGRSHRVLTGICLVGVEGRAETSVASTTVEFLPLDANQIAEYVATGEPMDKAGAYAIQGGARLFVRSLDGELANVIGLPISVVTELLRGV